MELEGQHGLGEGPNGLVSVLYILCSSSDIPDGRPFWGQLNTQVERVGVEEAFNFPQSFYFWYIERCNFITCPLSSSIPDLNSRYTSLLFLQL